MRLFLHPAFTWQRMLIEERNTDGAWRAPSEQTEPQSHVNNPRERHFLAISSGYIAGSIGRTNLCRNEQTKAVFKGKAEVTQAELEKTLQVVTRPQPEPRLPFQHSLPVAKTASLPQQESAESEGRGVLTKWR